MSDSAYAHEMRNEVHIRLKCFSRLIQRVHFGVKPQHVQTAWRSCSAKPRGLFFVRLVDKSKGLGTEHLAAHKPQLRLSRPLWEEPPSPSHDVGHN